VRGLISAGWECCEDQFTYQVELPPNVTATVQLPGETAGQARRVGSGAHKFAGPALARPSGLTCLELSHDA
jgi:hypothetical protein